jgi:hypothetical protein
VVKLKEPTKVIKAKEWLGIYNNVIVDSSVIFCSSKEGMLRQLEIYNVVVWFRLLQQTRVRMTYACILKRVRVYVKVGAHGQTFKTFLTT